MKAKVRRGRSVRRHLLAYALAFALPMLLLVGFLLAEFSAGERRRVESEALDTARRIAASVERELTGLRSALEVLSLSPYLLEGDLRGFHDQAAELYSRQGITAVLRDEEGRQLVNGRASWGQQLPVTPLAADGLTLDGGETEVSGVFFGPVAQTQLFSILLPVESASGETRLLSLSLPAARLGDIFEEGGVPEDWTASIVDRDGLILARNKDADEYVGTRATENLLDSTEGREGTWMGTTADGQEVFGAYARVPMSDWRVAVGVRLSDLAAPLRRSLGLLLALAAGLVGLSALLALFFERRIVAPMRALERQAEGLRRRAPPPPLATGLAEVDRVSLALTQATESLREKNHRLDILNRVGKALAAELDLDRLVQSVIDAATDLSGAAYGAYFRRISAAREGHEEDRWQLAALSGASKEDFAGYGTPRPTGLFGPTFQAEAIVRSDDVLADPRYGSLGGLPSGHLPVRSYLAVPVVSRSGRTLGALLFGHPEAARFGTREEQLIAGFAGQAAIALDNARLFQEVQRELESRRVAEEELATAKQEAELQAAERAAILGQLAEGVIVTDVSGRIVFVNEAAQRLHGVGSIEVGPEGYVEGYHLLTLDGRPHPVEDLPLTRAVTRGETVLDAHWRIRRPDGTEVIAIGSARPVIAPDGSRLGSVLTLRDDTSREASEREQRRLNEALAEQAAELAESNDELQRYAYIVSHDLRSPLVNVMGFTSELQAMREELLEAGARPADDPRRVQTLADFDEALGFIKAATAKMEALIAAILRLSREGRRRLEPQPLEMNPLLRDLADAIRHQTDSAGAVVEIADDLPGLVADRLAVEQVFGNLLDNAVKYLEPGRPGRITVTGEVRGARVAYRVADNGRGIAPQDHGRVFELFRRAGAQNRPGEGIGLAHVRTLVRAMGGRIELESEPGQGTTFIVVLPALPVTSTAARAAE